MKMYISLHCGQGGASRFTASAIEGGSRKMERDLPPLLSLMNDVMTQSDYPPRGARKLALLSFHRQNERATASAKAALFNAVSILSRHIGSSKARWLIVSRRITLCGFVRRWMSMSSSRNKNSDENGKFVSVPVDDRLPTGTGSCDSY